MPVPPGHRKPPGSLTLFQQPWTGKPSSPCSEEGRQMAQTLRQPPKQVGWGGQGPHTLRQHIRIQPTFGLFLFSAAGQSLRRGWEAKEANFPLTSAP